MLFRRGLLLLALTTSAPLWAGGAEVVDRIVAVVGRHAITLSEAEQALNLRTLRGGEDLSLPDVVDLLIEAYLIEREVRRYPGKPVSSEEVRRAVASVRATFETEEEFYGALRAQGMDLEALERLLKRQIRINRYLDDRFRSLVYVNDEEIGRYYEEDLVPALIGSGESAPSLEAVSQLIREILTERKFNERVERWIESLKSRARIRRYVW